MSPMDDSSFEPSDEFEIVIDEEDAEEEEEEGSLFAFTLQPAGERFFSLEELEEGYGSDSDGPDHDGYTAQEREWREIGGVAGMSMEIMAVEIPDSEQEDEEVVEDWYYD